jgi:hypothetical protein
MLIVKSTIRHDDATAYLDCCIKRRRKTLFFISTYA